MSQKPEPPMTLLVHDGELGDVRTLLEALGTPFVDRLGELDPQDRAIRWDLVIATPKRMLEDEPGSGGDAPLLKMAILEQDSRTLRNSLRRAGISLIVCRPVHRAALRALILHALYRGPEKRRAARVNIGAPVRFRAGWRQRDAILADLSIGGCRLLTHHAIERGTSFVLAIPAPLAGGKPLSVKAHVLQSRPAADPASGCWDVSARFDAPDRRVSERLKVVLAAHHDGPATYGGAGAIAAVSTRGPCEAGPPEGAAPIARAAALPALAAENTPAERRCTARHTLEQRTVALGEEASRVLMGFEISIGGMRIKPNPSLRVGMDLDLAIHIDRRDDPLVVRACVQRDDLDRGLVLRFHELEPETRCYLNNLMDQLPLVDDSDDGEGYLVTELLQSA